MRSFLITLFLLIGLLAAVIQAANQASVNLDGTVSECPVCNVYDSKIMEESLRNQLGLVGLGKVHANLSPARLVEISVSKNEAQLSSDGAIVARTGQHTGRSPNDKYVVKDASTEHEVDWGKVNQPYEGAKFDALRDRLKTWLQGREVFVQDLYVGADPNHRLSIRVISTYAWHNLFARNMFIRPTPEQLAAGHKPDFTVFHCPEFEANPAVDGTRSSTFVMINFAENLAMVGGTSYAGEVKKTIFTVMNYFLPTKGVLPMHASANIGEKGDTAIFFGLSGTGKTTLSADGARTLIGDDEHGWTENSIFNFEGGCYAKVIKLNPKMEPEIYAASRRFGTVLENVVVNPYSRQVDFDDGSLAENSRACYPLEYIPNTSATGSGGLPTNIIMLTCDAYGVLPPISKLTPEQAMYHFLSGYTARVAGTEKGVTEPTATFSSCFGAPFMPRSPEVYANMLGEKIKQHSVNVWLVNTGWSGGAPGVGQRMPINVTRTLLRAALSGELAQGEFVKDPVFGLLVPKSASNVDSAILHPREKWADKEAYDATARKLVSLFGENFKKFENKVGSEILAAAMGK